MALSPRPFGRGPFGVAGYSSGVIEIGGIIVVAFKPAGILIHNFQEPSQMCEPGTWTLTALPAGPPNDQLELVP